MLIHISNQKKKKRKKRKEKEKKAGRLCKLCAGPVKYLYYPADVVQNYLTIILLYCSIFRKKL